MRPSKNLLKPFVAADILLPSEDTDLTRFATIACDQFTGQRTYWRELDKYVKDVPSTYHLTLPEEYLRWGGVEERIEQIHENMRQYLKNVLTRKFHGFMYVERTTPSGTRPGIVGAIDLELYSFEEPNQSFIRPTEHTVADRLPPRIAVRRGAALETPHILMLVNDKNGNLVETMTKKRKRHELTCVYDFDLMYKGGSVRGYAITDPAEIARIENSAAMLGLQEKFDRKYPEAAGMPPFAMAVGDGNHSLAAAKAYWEELKPTLSPAERKNHPARYCLAEVVNLHCSALHIEPIHRVLMRTSFPEVTTAFGNFMVSYGSTVYNGPLQQGHEFTLFDSMHSIHCYVYNPPGRHPFNTIDMWITDYLQKHPQQRVEYVHGREDLRFLTYEEPGAVGIVMPPVERDGLLNEVALGGVLPKKAFSLGTAREKRYYLECRAL